MQEAEAQPDSVNGNVLCQAGGVAAMLLLVYSIVTMIGMLALGGPPATAQEAFATLQGNRLAGLFRLDALTLLIMPAYYFLFAGLYAALHGANRVYAAAAAVLAFIGVTLFLSAPSALSMAYLSDQYAAAGSEVRRNLMLAAGEAIIASDMWHGTGPMIGGMILQTACILISALMLPGKVFSKTTAWIGLVTHSLDLAHMVAGLIMPAAGFVLMAAAGPLYLVWFPLVGRRLYELRRTPTGTLPPLS